MLVSCCTLRTVVETYSAREISLTVHIAKIFEDAQFVTSDCFAMML